MKLFTLDIMRAWFENRILTTRLLLQ